jgi:trehalose 6-phosphate phosphatase
VPTPAHDKLEGLPVPSDPGPDADWALFLDVDGTVLDFAPRPDAVVVHSRLLSDLDALCARLNGAVALVSGRPLAQLDDLFGWNHRAAAGLHGAQLRTTTGRVVQPDHDEAFAELLREAAAVVEAAQGVTLEDKTHALALHYRHASAAREAADKIAHSLLELAGTGYALQRGDHVIELKPADADKGRALDAIMATAPFRGRRPWMLGDDLTDEDAFEHVNARDGVSVIVGPRRPTRARYAMPEPAAVRAWLHALADSHQRQGDPT